MFLAGQGDGVVTLCAFGSRDLERELATYERWMADERLREDTATEPMTPAEIRAMQSSWLEAPDKFNYLIWADDVPVGDIGLFYCTDADGRVDLSEGEISMMIAEPAFRRRGLGKRAHDLALPAAKAANGTTKVVAKISDKNAPSIAFFKKAGYRFVSAAPVFAEVTYELSM